MDQHFGISGAIVYDAVILRSYATKDLLFLARTTHLRTFTRCHPEEPLGAAEERRGTCTRGVAPASGRHEFSLDSAILAVAVSGHRV
jgi:hypothetical protein